MAGASFDADFYFILAIPFASFISFLGKTANMFNKAYFSVFNDSRSWCLSGERSFKVAQKLIQRGYCDVYVLKGGVMAWQRAGYMTQLMKLPA
ncbi:rhodanese-like domain-containing protein [Nostoc sp. FACHB-888]|uniref:rhodanese-like domain-containing protein n=1 Tax=Nostoc sp. FACHB-888 TaxID=2692842 RepID=UPI0016867F7A|nr:rhodanese-like domain-containing protein [Nostoc sp. FACHB-888]MBD2248920.1 rhodanese-like domain-containing protein [Nostoc sp. FACHB-888]